MLINVKLIFVNVNFHNVIIKWCVNFGDLDFHYFHPEFSIHSRKEKELFYQGGDQPLSWTLRRMLKVARFLHLTPRFSDNSTKLTLFAFQIFTQV